MCQNFHMNFSISRLMAASTQGGAQASLGSGDDAFSLPALAVFAAMETPLHLPLITRLGPAAAAVAWVELDDR